MNASMSSSPIASKNQRNSQFPIHIPETPPSNVNGSDKRNRARLSPYEEENIPSESSKNETEIDGNNHSTKQPIDLCSPLATSPIARNRETSPENSTPNGCTVFDRSLPPPPFGMSSPRLSNESSILDTAILDISTGDDETNDSYGDEEETLMERLSREEEESEALARQLMAEEAMQTWHAMSATVIRDNMDNYSSEDLAAFQAVLDEDEAEPEEYVDPDASYETLLRLGERMGDVKQERWAMVAKERIKELPIVKYSADLFRSEQENDSFVKCLVCQCEYEEGERLRKLPCSHCFHVVCVDQWLATKDMCPYCRQTIVKSR